MPIAKINNPSYLLKHSQHEYFTEKDSESGVFMGRLAKYQKLEGKPVDQKNFERLISYGEGFNGVEIDPSPPKDWSILIQRVSDDERAKLNQVWQTAMTEVVKAIEQNTYYRETKDGKTEYKLAKAVCIAKFDHHTSRGVNGQIDLQEHSHLVVLPKVLGQDGKFHSHTLYDLKYEKNGHETLRYFDAVMQYHLSKGLNELGYGVSPDKNGNFNIDGITNEQRKFFSKRTNQINELAGEDATYAKKKEVSLKVRNTKTDHDLGELRQDWQKDMDRLGLTSDKAQSIKSAQRNLDRSLIQIVKDGGKPVLSAKGLKTLAYREAMFSNKTMKEKLDEFKDERKLKSIGQGNHIVVHNTALTHLHKVASVARMGSVLMPKLNGSQAQNSIQHQGNSNQHPTFSSAPGAVSAPRSTQEIISSIKALEQQLMSLKLDDPQRANIEAQIGNLNQQLHAVKSAENNQNTTHSQQHEAVNKFKQSIDDPKLSPVQRTHFLNKHALEYQKDVENLALRQIAQYKQNELTITGE